MPRKRKSGMRAVEVPAPVPVEVLDQFIREGPNRARSGSGQPRARYFDGGHGPRLAGSLNRASNLPTQNLFLKFTSRSTG